MKTNLYYKDVEGNLRTLSYGNAELDLEAVSSPMNTRFAIAELGLNKPVGAILCAIEGGKLEG